MILAAAVLLLAAAAPYARWWQAGSGGPFAARQEYPDPAGSVRILFDGASFETAEHPFFKAIGANGRACITCHQPANAMSLSVGAIDAAWAARGAADPLFAAIDGANCPDLPAADPASHSLLLRRGLFRISRDWPPRDSEGRPITPDFTIAVVRDPTGCNQSPRFGLHARHPMISVFRRPRMVANLKYVLATGFDDDPKDGLPLPIDPHTGTLSSGNLMADGRLADLAAQMNDAGATHLQMLRALTAQERAAIADFETRIYAAQQTDRLDGATDGAGAAGGPAVLEASPPGRLGDIGFAVWSEFSAWGNAQPGPGVSADEAAFRRSVARGAVLFRTRTFLISDTAGINGPIGFGNPIRNSCVFCHNMSRIGMDVAPGHVDIGTANLPFADPAPELPLFRITCTGAPNPFLGTIILTHDPGYALTTGRCADVGRITIQSLRGLAARAPYFASGAAADLSAVVEYYDRRYHIGLSAQDKQDLVNLMSVL